MAVEISIDTNILNENALKIQRIAENEGLELIVTDIKSVLVNSSGAMKELLDTGNQTLGELSQQLSSLFSQTALFLQEAEAMMLETDNELSAEFTRKEKTWPREILATQR
jgi:hypothetical protein